MLMSSFYAAISGVVDWVNSMRPSWTPTIDPSMAQAFQMAAAWDWICPVHETVYCIGAFIALVTAFIAFKWIIKIADWIADVIP
jgi:hypothetical protein